MKKKHMVFSAKVFSDKKKPKQNTDVMFRTRALEEFVRLEVCVGDGDPPQLNYLWVGDAPLVVASVDGLVVADIKASPYKRWQTLEPASASCLFLTETLRAAELAFITEMTGQEDGCQGSSPVNTSSLFDNLKASALKIRPAMQRLSLALGKLAVAFSSFLSESNLRAEVLLDFKYLLAEIMPKRTFFFLHQ